jgi:preprotein translocase subunit SecE
LVEEKFGWRAGRQRELGKTMARVSPFEFLQQVRTEVAKVTWPTRSETVTTTIMVLIMSILAALFFLAADVVLHRAVLCILKFECGILNNLF